MTNKVECNMCGYQEPNENNNGWYLFYERTLDSKCYDICKKCAKKIKLFIKK